MMADFTRNCEGCIHVVAETGYKDHTYFRCFAEGRCKGFTIGTDRLVPYIPAWCPGKVEEQKHD